jgi:hypothetical protein
MATHERQAIREAIVAQLKGRTSAGVRVFKSRREPLREMELPAITVYTDEETVDDVNTAPRELKRQVSVAVIGWVMQSASVDDALDALALEIETAMDADMFLGGTSPGASRLASVAIGEKLDGARPMGAVNLTYTATYFTDLRIALEANAFTTVDVKTSVTPGQALADRAENILAVPQV